LDTAEDYLHQTTGSVQAQATGSSGAQAIGNIPGQTTGSSEAQVTGNFEARTAESSEVATTGSFGGQDTGSPEVQIAEGSEVATTVSPVERASAQAVVYPNSGSVNPTIIIENNNRQFTVMNSDATEEPGSLERGSQGATVTTGVAGAEQMTRTGHQYTQISRTHVEPVLEELGETSRECSHFSQTVVPGTTVEAHTCEGGGMPLERVDDYGA